MTTQNQPSKRRSRRNAEPRAIYSAIYGAECNYGLKDCEEKALEELEKAYATGADVNEPGVGGKPPILSAAEIPYEFEKIVRWLLEHGADVQACDNMGNTVLHVARKDSILSLLLQYGADVNACNKLGEAPLHIAANDDSCFRVDFLLQHGADVNLRSEMHGTPLQYVIACNRWKSAVGEIIHSLCAAGADVELPDEEGCTCLHHAARVGDVISARALIEGGADVHARDAHMRTSLMYAACSDSPEMISLLYSKGAEMNAQDAAGCTAADYARMARASDMVKLLLGAAGEKRANREVRIPPASLHRLSFLPQLGRWTSMGTMAAAFRVALAGGADPNERWYRMRKSVLHRVVGMGEVKLARILLEAGADVNAQDAWGVSPLIFALYRKNNARMVHLLLDYGADANAKDRYGWTALMFACRKKNCQLIPALLAAGADVNVHDPCHGWTALHMLVRECNDTEMLTLMLEAGADVNARDEPLRTPLMLAACYRKKEYMEVLLAHGADAFARDCDGNCALQYMPRRLYCDNPDMVQRLTPPEEH